MIKVHPPERLVLELANDITIAIEYTFLSTPYLRIKDKIHFYYVTKVMTTPWHNYLLG